MRRNPFRTIAACLLIGVIGLSIICYVFFGVDRDQMKNNRMLIAEMMDNRVMESLSEPLTVSKMISQDEYLKEILKKESAYSEDEMVTLMRNYLYEIKKHFDYSTVYVISDSSKKYYSYAGLNKVINPENNSFDTWYTDFLDLGKQSSVESSTDEVNLNELTVFVDARVEDESGKLLGVSGVGIETANIMRILSSYEEQYGVRIDYVTSNGLVQMSSRTAAVHSSYVSGINYPVVTDNSYHYQSYGVGGFAIVKYIEDLDWYLVIRSEKPYETNNYNYVYFFSLILILFVALTILFIAGKQLKVESGGGITQRKNVDGQTGLPNRDYFDKVYGERGILNTTRYKCIAEFAIDDFESMEQTALESRIIISVVRAARESFGQHGELMRWNKNSFVVLFEIPVDEAETACKEFCKSIEDRGEVTVSIGLTEIDLKETLMRNYYRAVQNLYLVKELGGNNVKRG